MWRGIIPHVFYLCMVFYVKKWIYTYHYILQWYVDCSIMFSWENNFKRHHTLQFVVLKQNWQKSFVGVLGLYILNCSFNFPMSHFLFVVHTLRNKLNTQLQPNMIGDLCHFCIITCVKVTFFLWLMPNGN
jgi:hypothetical protein